MGLVRFDRCRTEQEDMPPLCLRCGAPATVIRSKTFSKSQGWTFILIFLGGLPYLLVQGPYGYFYHYPYYGPYYHYYYRPYYGPYAGPYLYSPAYRYAPYGWCPHPIGPYWCR